jgi:multidrug efflux pump subunit AcrA (membrane-fusion protein)
MESPKQLQAAPEPLFIALPRILLAVLLPIGILAGAIGVFMMLKASFKPPAASADAKPIPQVRVVTLKPTQVTLDLTAYGEVRSKRMVNMAPEVSGITLSVAPNFREGLQVKQGQELLRLEPSLYDAEVASAKARVAEANASLLTLKQEEENLKRQVEVTKQKLALLADEVQRLTSAVEEAAASVIERDVTKLRMLQEETNLVTNENALALIPARQAQALAQLQAAEGNLKRAEYNQGRTVVRAPFDALVMSRHVEVGQYVTSFTSNAPVGRLDSLEMFEIPVMIEPEELRQLPTFDLEEGALGADGERLANGPEARVRWTNFSGAYTWEGRVARIGAMDTETRTIPVIVEIQRPWDNLGEQGKPRLEIGAYCEVHITGKVVPDALLAPEKALRENDRLFFLRDGKLEIEPVRVAARVAGQLVVQPESVSDGKGGQRPSFQSGEQVILSSVAYPVPGMRLDALQDESDAPAREP